MNSQFRWIGVFLSVQSRSLFTQTFRAISLGWKIAREDCSVFDCVCPEYVYRCRNICAPQYEVGGDGSSSLYNLHHTNNVCCWLLVKALFP